jgi:hypothetical protein
MTSADGQVYAFGDATFDGSLVSIHRTPAAPIVGIAATSSGSGYWLVGADGGVFAFGNATFEGSSPGSGGAPAPVVGIEPTPDGGGYWLATTTGVTISFGDATKLGNATPTATMSGVSG